MATYVEMRTDGFARNLQDIIDRKALDFEGVRRPLRGVEIKDDTYAVIKVIRSDGKEVPLVDSGSKITADSFGIHRDTKELGQVPSPGASTFNYSNFIAQQIVDARSEKQQIVETFGEPYIFFYGEKPRIMQVQGLLMNTLDFNWKNEFWKNYENNFRGTRLVELDARIYFYFDDQIVEGYMLDAQASHSADFPYHVPFQFTLFVTAHTYIGLLSSSGDYPISANLNIKASEQIDLLSMDAVEKLRKRRDDLRPKQLLSTTWEVRYAAEKAAGPFVGKAAIQAAIFKGLGDFEAKTNAFLANVKTYFYGRRMIVPKGIAGAELLAGQATFADAATFPGIAPRRDLPLRSKITDNYDEYIGGSLQALPTGLMEEEVDLNEIFEVDMEKKLLLELAKLGVDVTKPSKMQNWRSDFTHTITKTADSIDFAAGIAIHGVGSLVNKAGQMANLALSLPGTLASTAAGMAKAAKPPFIP